MPAARIDHLWIRVRDPQASKLSAGYADNGGPGERAVYHHERDVHGDLGDEVERRLA